MEGIFFIMFYNNWHVSCKLNVSKRSFMTSLESGAIYFLRDDLGVFFVSGYDALLD